ncbi:MAG: CPBP family intramembrane metalloprotease [Gemmatimonadetes bacterium]|nr:CPBP family intramembrane metalloprotease [Gemmatimonadota bacterium]
MMGAGAGFARTGAWVQAAGRILLFLGIFLAILVAGSPLVTGEQESFRFLVLSSAVTLAAAFGAGAIVLVRWDRRRIGALGFAWTRATAKEIAAGLAIGTASMGVAAGALVATGAIGFAGETGTATTWLAALAAHFAILALGAAAEEALFRGYAFQVLSRMMGPVAAVLVTSAAFAVAHGRNPGADWIAVTNIFLAGVLLAAAYLRTRSLWFATAVHLGWNWGMASLLDLPVSGLDMLNTPLYEPVSNGPGWLTGGAFGPEGGLAGTVAAAIALGAILRWPGLDEAEPMRTLRPLVDTEEA